MSKDIQCIPHPNTVTKKDGGDYGTYLESGAGRKPLPFALAEKIDNAIAATTDNPPELKKLVEVFFLFDDNQSLMNICIRDNGSGMDTDGLRGYATYHYSQEARKRDASGGDKQAASSEALSARNCDPQALDGRIGHFGVGGQHSVFFMGFMEHIMTKTTDDTKVNDMVISGDEMHKKWDKGKRDEVYNFKVNQRDPGDTTLLDQKREMHPYLKELIKREKDSEKSSQFSLFVISKIKPEHIEALKDFDKNTSDEDEDEVVKVTMELARVYHYYLHGRDGDVEPSSSSESNEDEDSDLSDSEEEEQFSKAPRKRRRRPSMSVSSSRKKRVNRAEEDENISVKILFHAYKGKELRLTSNLFDIDNVEKLMHKRARGEPFRIGLKPQSGVQVVVCLYFFPVLFGKETRPVDEYEKQELQEEEPILSCYWQGRWIPYAQVKKLKFLEVTKADDNITKLQGRIRGTIWFPRNVLPSNNKLFLQKSPEVMLSDPNLRIFQIENWEEENHKGVRTTFRKWLQDCSKEYDMNLEFKDRLEHDATKNETHFGKLRYGHAEYKRADKIRLRKGLLVYGVIEHFICEGNLEESAVGSSGMFAFRRYPLEIFGGVLQIENIDKLSSKMRNPEELQERLKSWKEEVEILKQKTPQELAVHIHRGTDDVDQKLRPKKLNFQLGGGGSDALGPCYPQKLEEEAGYQVPPLDVYIVSEEGRPVSSVLANTKRSQLAVQLKVKKLTDDGQDAKSRRVDSYVVEGGAHLQKKANPSCGYEFPTLGECFDGAGDYDLTFHVPAFHRKIMAMDGPNEGSWVPEEPITWTTRVTVRAAQPNYFQTAKWRTSKPVFLGVRTKSLVQVSFRDQFRSKGSKRSLGNLCFLKDELPTEDFQVELQVTQPAGLNLEVSFSEKERGDRGDENGWFWLDVKAVPVEGVERFSVLCTPPYNKLEVKGTMHVKMKTSTGHWKVLDPLEHSEQFEFILGPGRPKQLICCNQAPSEAIAVENHGELPVIQVQALDQWGHVVLQDKSMKALKIREVLESQETVKELKGRNQREATWEAYEAQVDMVTGYAELGKRRVRLEKPGVTRVEKHELVYTLVSEQKAANSSSNSNDPNLEINVDISPSTLPHDVRAFRAGKAIEDGEVYAPAGSEVADITFQFYDEAGNSVNVNAKSRWLVRGGGWDAKRDVTASDPISMPAVTMRTKADDALNQTVVFTGPALDSHHPPTLPVDLSFIPHAAAPKQWLFAEPDRDVPCKEVLQLSVGQKLREAFCLQLQDEFQNAVGAEACQSYAPKLLIIKGKDQKAPEKKGDWDTFELDGNRFLPAEDATLEGGAGVLTFMVSNASSSSAARVDNSKQQVQLVCGKPHRLRMSLVGTPTGDDIDDVADVEGQRWKSCSVIDRVVIQVVDQWGNPVDRLKEKLEVVLEVEGGTLQAELCERSSEGDEALRGTVKKENGERVWKKVKMRMPLGDELLKSSSLVAKCATGNIESAIVKLDCKPCNKVTKLEIEDSAYAPSAPPLHAGDKPRPLQVTVRTEDGQPYEGSADAIRIRCVHHSNKQIDLYDVSSVERVINTFTFQPKDDAVFQQTGTYTLMVWYEEARPALLETLMKCDRALNAEKHEFCVRAGGAFNLRIKECEVSAGTTAAVSNGSDPLWRQIARSVELRLVDEFDNAIKVKEKWKVGASIHLLKQTMQDKTKEVFCDLEFVFCNDAQRGQSIAKMREELNKLENDKRVALKDQTTKTNKVISFQGRYEKSLASLKEQKNKALNCGVEDMHLESAAAMEAFVKQLETRMKESHNQRRRANISPGTQRLVQIAKQKYGDQKVLGTILDLCYIEDDTSNTIICWRNKIDLTTIVFKHKEDAKDFVDLPAAREVFRQQPRVLGLDMAARWPGVRGPDVDFLPHFKQDQAFLNERMAINQLKFYDEANEPLRETMLWALINAWVIMPTRKEAMDYMQMCRTNRRNCPEMISRDDGNKIASNGVMGGANSRAPERLGEQDNYCGSKDLSRHTQEQLATMKELMRLEQETASGWQHYMHIKDASEKAQQKAKKNAWDFEQASKKMAAEYAKSLSERDAARNQTPNATFTPYSPGHGESKSPPVLDKPDATIGMDTPMRFAAVDKDGAAKFSDLALQEKSGQDEESYVVRFQLYTDRNQPVFRSHEGNLADLTARSEFREPTAAPAEGAPAQAPPQTPISPPPQTPQRQASGGSQRQPPSGGATQASQRQTPSFRRR